MKFILEMESDGDFDPEEAIREISEQNYGDLDDEGTIELGDGIVKWRHSEVVEGVDIDRRQRQVAAMMISAFDLPQEMTKAAASWLVSAKLMPGSTMSDIMPAPTGRLSSMMAARDLLSTMIDEINKEQTKS